jgi:hypothetical protein
LRQVSSVLSFKTIPIAAASLRSPEIVIKQAAKAALCFQELLGPFVAG